MEPGILIGAFTAVFVVTFRYIWKRHVLFGGFYVFLFIYAIFAEIGYAFFPEVSMLVRAYFGPELFPRFSIFVTLSFVTFFLCFKYLHPYVIRRPAYEVVISPPTYRPMFYAAIAIHLVGLLLYFVANFDVITYTDFSNEDVQAQMGLGYRLFGAGFKLSVAVILVLWVLFRVRTSDAPAIDRRPVLLMLVLELGSFSSSPHGWGVASTRWR